MRLSSSLGKGRVICLNLGLYSGLLELIKSQIVISRLYVPKIKSIYLDEKLDAKNSDNTDRVHFINKRSLTT
jgi:hypothetical protein